VGNGARHVVILPGLADALWAVTDPSWDVAQHYRRLADAFTVFVISRRRGMPSGYTTKDMAADYATVFARELGPCPVVGISLGGCIAQHLAANFPQYVPQLVLACAGHRVSDEGRTIPEHWLELARHARWREFYFDIAKVTLQEFHHTFYQFLLPLVRMKAPDPGDFLVSLEASLTHDGTDALGHIQAPTLVIGGAKDIFFPPALLLETTRRIPDAALRFIDESGHGAYELQRAKFENAVLAFLTAHAAVGNWTA
jgi:pimeloyl-ACP methyl ester carboxylesterase